MFENLIKNQLLSGQSEIVILGQKGNSTVAFHCWYERSCCGQLLFLLSAAPHVEGSVLGGNRVLNYFGAEKGQFHPFWCPFVHHFHVWKACWRNQPSRRKEPQNCGTLEPGNQGAGGVSEHRWYLQVCLLEQKVGGFFIDMVERKWIKSTNEINWKKIKTQINKQTWPESWKEMKEMSWHKHKNQWQNRKVIFFMYGLLESPGMGKCAEEEISANTKLKAELTQDSRKASLGFASTLHMRGADKGRGEKLGTAPEPRPGQHSIPREGDTAKWGFSCPTCLSCKTTAALENCSHLIISSSGIFCAPSANSISFNCAQTEQSLPSPAWLGGALSAIPLVTREEFSKAVPVPWTWGQGCGTELPAQPGQGVWGALICDWPHRPCKTL